MMEKDSGGTPKQGLVRNETGRKAATRIPRAFKPRSNRREEDSIRSINLKILENDAEVSGSVRFLKIFTIF